MQTTLGGLFLGATRQGVVGGVLSILEMATKEIQNPADERQVALRGRQLQEFQSRRAANTKQRSESPKHSGQLMSSLAKQFTAPTTPGYFREGPMLKAMCKRLAGRTTVIGNTVFTFDKAGICRIINQGNTALDYEFLLKQNGVHKLDDDEKIIPRYPLSPAVEETPALPVFEVPVEDDDEVEAEHDEMEAAPPAVIVPPMPTEKSVDKFESRKKPAKSK